MMDASSLLGLGIKLIVWINKIRELRGISRENEKTISYIERIVNLCHLVASGLNSCPRLMEDRGISESLRHLKETCRKVLQKTKVDQVSQNNYSSILKEIKTVLGAEKVEQQLSKMQDELSKCAGFAAFAVVANTAKTIEEIHDSLRQLQREQKARKREQKARKKIGSAEVYPLKLRFPEGKSRCPITLINRTDEFVGFWIKPAKPKFSQFFKTISVIVEPRSSWAVSVRLSDGGPPADLQLKLEARMIILWSQDKLRDLMRHIRGNVNINIHDVEEMVKKLKGEVRLTMLTAGVVGCEPEINLQVDSKFEVTNMIKSIDVHPTETWILITDMSGNLSIYDYHTKRTLRTLESPVKVKFVSAKFISRKNWVVAGDSGGYIHVYDCSALALREFKELKASTKGNLVDSLAVHPTKPYLLSSSSSSTVYTFIKLWDWENNWERKLVFEDEDTWGVRSLTFNPRDHDSFACVTSNKNALVWRIKSSTPTNTLPEVMDAKYVFTPSRPYFLAILRTSELLEIWNLRKAEKPVHTLKVRKGKTGSVACHPTLPILATFSRSTGNVCLWDAKTYRLEKEVHIARNPRSVKLLFPDTGDLPRLLVWWKNTKNTKNYVAVVDATFTKGRRNKGRRTGSSRS